MVCGNLDANGTGEIPYLSAFSWIAGNIEDPFRVSMAHQAIF